MDGINTYYMENYGVSITCSHIIRKEYQKIVSPTLDVGLSQSGMCRSIAVYVGLQYQGLCIKNLYTTMGIEYIISMIECN